MTVKLSTWSLKLNDLNNKDFGNYSCQATNILGTAQGYSPVAGKYYDVFDISDFIFLNSFLFLYMVFVDKPSVEK